LNCIYEDAKELAGSVEEDGSPIAGPDGSSSTLLSLSTADFPGLPVRGSFEQDIPQFEGLLEDVDMDPALWNGGLDWDWLFECGEHLDVSKATEILPNYEMHNGYYMEPGFGSRGGDLLLQNDGRANSTFSILPTPEPQDTCGPNDPWPLEWHAEGQQALDLPNLNDETNDRGATFYGMKSLGDSFRKKIQEAIRLPLEHPPWRAVSLANFPSKTKLDRCIDLFFAHHNSVCYPFASRKSHNKLTINSLRRSSVSYTGPLLNRIENL
jgi:hypothetical protein